MIHPAIGLLLADAPQTIQICIAPIRHYLRQAGVQIKGVTGCVAIYHLLQSVTETIVGVGVDVRSLRYAHQPVGVIVAVAAGAI
ncbi:MAG: hypothetical protein K8R91_04935 [Phycisphaerae bacterium]|nr:hypothetical protein [Phycisphaerae bacterium]